MSTIRRPQPRNASEVPGRRDQGVFKVEGLPAYYGIQVLHAGRKSAPTTIFVPKREASNGLWRGFFLNSTGQEVEYDSVTEGSRSLAYLKAKLFLYNNRQAPVREEGPQVQRHGQTH